MQPAVCFVSFCLLTLSLCEAQSETGRTCPPGTFETGNECRLCLKNTFSNVENAFECTPCPPRQVSNQNSTACQFCDKGRIFSDGDCRPCPRDFYNDEIGALQCKPCPDGKVAPKIAKSVDKCVTCRLNTTVNRRDAFVRCEPCFAGRTLKVNASKCVKCAPGTVNILRFAGCKVCQPGKFNDKTGGSCRRCPKGFYQLDSGARQCVKCPKDSDTKGKGAKSCRPTCDLADPKCVACLPGQGFDAVKKKCQVCPAGTVSLTLSTTPCIKCPGDSVPNEAKTKCVCPPTFQLVQEGCRECRPGFKADESGKKCICALEDRLFPDDCRCPPLTKLKGLKCVPCKPEDNALICRSCGGGRVFNEKARRCDKCPANTYSGGVGKNGLSSKCLPCPGGSTSKRGSRRCKCKPGFGLQDGKCKMCPPGTSPSLPGITVKVSNVDKDLPLCYPCPRETAAGAGSRRCRGCPFGREPQGIGNAECLPECPPGASRKNNKSPCECGETFASSGSGDSLVCTECEKTEIGMGDKCVCASGQFEGPNNKTCIGCGKNGFIAKNGCSCDFGFGKQKGRCVACPPGTRGVDSKCEPCPPGQANGREGNFFCRTCRRDKALPFDGIVCLPLCLPGSFRDKDQMCVSCEPGQRVLNRVCIDCEDGSVSPGGDSAQCTKCPDGEKPNSDKSACAP